MSDHDGALRLRCQERVLGNYFERMSFAVHKDVGSREHKFKLDDPRFLSEDFESIDA